MTRSDLQTQTDLSLIPQDKSDRLRLFGRLVTYSVNNEEEENSKFLKNVEYVFENALTAEDKKALRLDNRPTLNYPILKPYLMRTLKNIIDASPTLSVEPSEEDSTDENYQLPGSTISLILEKTLREILEKNHSDNILFGVAMDCAIGGKGVIKLRSDYQNQYNFQQKIVIECVNDPTLVFFDPRAKKITGADGEYTGELCLITKEEFLSKYPKIRWDDIIYQAEDFNAKMESGQKKLKWFRKEKNIVCISDFYYKKRKKKTIYNISDGTILERKLTEKEELSGLYITAKRKVEFIEIWHTQFCGNVELKKPELTNFHDLVYIKCPSEIIWKNGKAHLQPFAKPAFDAQRTKNFFINYFLFDTLNHDKGKTFIPYESIADQEALALRHPQDENILYYNQYMQNPAAANELVPLNPPHYIAPPPIDNAPIEAAQFMNQDIEKILGLQFPSADEVNLSGKALYNMADFMSASNELFMQNLLVAWQHVGTIILEAMPNILPPRLVGLTPPGKNPAHPSTPVVQQFQYKYDFTRGFYMVNITRGVNYKLQQQKNVEMLLQFGQFYPPLLQFLFSDGFDFMISNMDFNDKEKLEEAYQNYQQKMQQQSMQSGAQQMQAMEMQQRQQQVQTQAANAQAHLMKAQTEQQRLQLQYQQLQHQKNETTTNALIELKKISSSDKKNYLDNLVKVEHIHNTAVRSKSMEGVGR